ncbi:CMP-N-acetylneuraminate-beta-1,4-galactoside alpha-2,3-sialyltransferase-like [Petromyzon marinus]|uniref:CMP-N-acetylneuraminate-beta-1,4-galactoside alpha-2,3-sialyltransferase-like n=1 Tax=Petromyzon marinus TaxID=7757 RepID=UPI003F70A603
MNHHVVRPGLLLVALLGCSAVLVGLRSTLGRSRLIPVAASDVNRISIPRDLRIALRISANTTTIITIDPHVNLFLRPEDLTSTQLVHYGLPFGIGNSGPTLKRILNRTKRYGLNVSSPRRCVVVGNGHVLKGRGLGAAIDRHDVIIRMNDAPTLGHEVDGEGSLMAVLAFKPADLQWLQQMVEKNVSLPTTGFIAVLAALHACPEVSIAGFGYPANSPGALVHYYGQSRMQEITKVGD